MAEASEHAPPEYIHIESCVAGPGSSLELGSDSLYPGCQCEGHCVSNRGGSCLCRVAYDEKSGHLLDEYLLPDSPPLFECNSKCTCSDKCPNRTTQHPATLHLNVFETIQKGFGIRSTHPIQRGTFVGEYIGEVISKDQATKRLQTLTDTDSCYILQFREHMASGMVLTTNIDATCKGNLMRFVNHSCSPNLTMIAVRSDSIVPRLCLFANRDISGLEELCFSYSGRTVGCEVTSAQHGVQLGRKPCLCGAVNCVGFLPLQV